MSSRATWNASRFPWMSAIIANFMSCHYYLSYNLKPAKIVVRVAPGYLFVLNEALEPRFPYRLAKCVQFIARAFGEQLYPAIRQIAHDADDLEPADDGLNRVAKTDALHSSRVKNLHPCALHGTLQA